MTRPKAPALTRPAPVITEAKRDEIHERFSAKCEYDAETDCWIYTGAWHSNGAACCKVAGRWMGVARVSAWIYQGGFELFDFSVRIKRRRELCSNPACFNPDHLKTVPPEPLLFELSSLELRTPPEQPKRARKGQRIPRPEPLLFLLVGMGAVA